MRLIGRAEHYEPPLIVAAGKLQRSDDETVGGEGQPCARFLQGEAGQAGLILMTGRLKDRGEDVCNQVVHGFATAAMRHRHQFVAQRHRAFSSNIPGQ